MSILDTLGIRRKSPVIDPQAPEAQGQAPELEEQVAEPEFDPYEMVEASALVSEVNREYERRKKERKSYELQWMLNMAFIEGNQYIDINYTSQTIIDVMAESDWEEREVFNHIAPNIETRIARLSKMTPILKVRPGSNEISDLRKTKVSSQLLQNIYYEKRIADLMADAISWIEFTGTVIFKQYWDQNSGPIISWPQIMPDGTQVLEEAQQGDLGVMVCPPQEIFPNSNYCQEISDCESLIHARVYSCKAVKEIWGVEVEPDESGAKELQRSMLGKAGGKSKLGTYTGPEVQINELKDTVVVKEFWEIPSHQYPQGRLIIVANQTLLNFDPLPYKCGPDMSYGLPFTKCVCIRRPGVFWGKTVIERLIPLQRRYNALRNRKAEYLTSCAIGNWLIEENSVDMEDLEANAGKPGHIIIYRKGTTAMPQKVSSPALPQAFETEEYTLLQEFSILSGVSEMSRQGKAPTGVKSGVAISLALEQDETRLSSVADNIKRCLVHSGAQYLRFYKQFAKGPQMLRFVNRNNTVDISEWMASDLKSEDVILDSFSALSESPTQKRQMVFDLLGTGLFMDPDTGRVDRNTRNRILDMLQFTDWEGIDDDDELHMAKAERENRAMSEGQIAYPSTFDNHLLHINKHDIYRVSVDYESLIAENQIIAELFEQHTQLHMMAFNAMMGPSMNGSVAPQDGQSSGGQPPPPNPSAEEVTGETSQARSAETRSQDSQQGPPGAN